MKNQLTLETVCEDSFPGQADRKIARKLGIAHTTVHTLKNGSRDASLNTVLQFALHEEVRNAGYSLIDVLMAAYPKYSEAIAEAAKPIVK